MTPRLKTSLLAGAIVLALPMLATAAQTSARTAPDAVPAVPAGVAPYAPMATITESFDTLAGTSPNQCPTGWICSNVSSPAGTSNWFQGSSAVFPAQAGPVTGYIGTNFNNTTGTNTISNWLITPVMQFGTGAELRFWARTTTATTYPDRLEIRASTGGSNNGGTPTSTGDFSILLGTINPSLSNAVGTCAIPAGAPNAGGFPNVWCEYRLTNADGIPASGSGRIAFRYFVTSGGPTGTNSNYIGIDTFSFVEGSAPMTSTPVSGSTIAMPAYTVGNPAVTASVNFTNPNAAAGTVTCVAPGAAQFSVAPLVINVPGSGSAATTISFSSASSGPFSSTLNCTGSGGETFSFPLTASATALIGSTPASGSTITMPAYTIGNPAVTASVNFTNPNAAAATVTCAAPGATQFTVAPLTINLPGNGNASTTISFSSASSGSFSGTLNCTGSGGESFSFNLSGSAAALMTSAPVTGTTITMPAYTVGFPPVTSTIAFSNPNATAGTITCAAPGASQFTVAPLSINVPANSNASTTISFSTNVSGAFNSTLTCSGSNGEAFSFPLVGNGGVPAVPVPAMGGSARWLLLLGVLGLGAFAARRRWA